MSHVLQHYILPAVELPFRRRIAAIEKERVVKLTNHAISRLLHRWRKSAWSTGVPKSRAACLASVRLSKECLPLLGRKAHLIQLSSSFAASQRDSFNGSHLPAVNRDLPAFIAHFVLRRGENSSLNS